MTEFLKDVFSTMFGILRVMAPLLILFITLCAVPVIFLSICCGALWGLDHIIAPTIVHLLG